MSLDVFEDLTSTLHSVLLDTVFVEYMYSKSSALFFNLGKFYVTALNYLQLSN